MRYEDTLKKELVSQCYDGKSISSICLPHNIPRSTFYTWVKPYKTIYTQAGYEVSAVELMKLKNVLPSKRKSLVF